MKDGQGDRKKLHDNSFRRVHLSQLAPFSSIFQRFHQLSGHTNHHPMQIQTGHKKKFSCILHVLDQWESYQLKSLTIDKDERNHVTVLSSQSKSPFFHSKNQILQSDIPHIYTSPKTIQFHHTLNAPEVERKDLKSESKNYRNRELHMDFLVD